MQMEYGLPLFVPRTKADAERSLQYAQEIMDREPYRAKFAVEEFIEIYNSLGVEVPPEARQLEAEIGKKCEAYTGNVDFSRLKQLIADLRLFNKGS